MTEAIFPETPDNSNITELPKLKGNTWLGINYSKIIPSTVSCRAVWASWIGGFDEHWKTKSVQSVILYCSCLSVWVSVQGHKRKKAVFNWYFLRKHDWNVNCRLPKSEIIGSQKISWQKYQSGATVNSAEKIVICLCNPYCFDHVLLQVYHLVKGPMTFSKDVKIVVCTWLIPWGSSGQLSPAPGNHLVMFPPTQNSKVPSNVAAGAIFTVFVMTQQEFNPQPTMLRADIPPLSW